VEVRVLYLDIDDEITTAAARVRGADGTRVAMVLPHGSRVATSRINFRLLARDATLNGKRLSIVASDAATRALAASAGLPIFASVAEYESSIEVEREGRAEAVAGEGPAGVSDAPASPPVPRGSPRSVGRRKPRAPAEVVAAAPTLGLAPEPVAPEPVAPEPVAPEPDVAELVPLATPRAPATVPAARVVADTNVDDALPGPARAPGSRVRPSPFGRSVVPGAIRAPLVIAAAVLALALVVGGVGAYLFLPTATAVITPRETAIGPVPLRIVADPAVTAPDPVGRTVPAVTKAVPVEVSQSFAVTGKRVEETAAAGVVRFDNFNPVSSNTIARGSIVSTSSGVRFRTDRAVTVPAAQFDPSTSTITPTSRNVSVTAVDPGTSGNVPANRITRVPRDENGTFLDVTNPDATSGGKREEFPRVVQADLDAATNAITDGLAAAFAKQLADPALVGDGTTVFAETAVLGEATFTIDPRTLLGDEVETFDLGATASGTVLAVDESAVKVVAEANIVSQVEAGYALVDGSSLVEASPGQVEAGVITFPASITARQVLLLDPAAIEVEIRGKTLAEAQSILDGYGRAELSVWPDWVGTIPTLDARVEVTTTTPAAP